MTAGSRPLLISILSVAVIAPALLSPQISVAGAVAQGAPRILYADTLLILPEARPQTKLLIQSSATVGRISNSYTYKYLVTNEGSTGVRRFALEPVGVPDSVVMPPHWAGSFEPDDGAGTVVWAVADTLTPPPRGWEERAAWPSPFEIQPGKVVTFVLFCHRPPAPMISFLAQAFDSLSASDVDPGDDADSDRGGAPPADEVRGSALGPAVGGADGEEANPEQAVSPPWSSRSNRSRSVAAISFFLPKRADVRLSVYDSRGHRVKGLIQRSLGAGFHSITWDGTDSKGIAAAGGYSFRLFVGVTRVGERRLALSHGA